MRMMTMMTTFFILSMKSINSNSPIMVSSASASASTSASFVAGRRFLMTKTRDGSGNSSGCSRCRSIFGKDKYCKRNIFSTTEATTKKQTTTTTTTTTMMTMGMTKTTRNHRRRSVFPFLRSTCTPLSSKTTCLYSIDPKNDSRFFTSTSLSSSSLTAEQEQNQHNQQDGQEQEHEQENDTIFALSSGYTGQQVTALAVIRISGPYAHNVLQALIKTKLPKPRVATLRKLYYTPPPLNDDDQHDDNDNDDDDDNGDDNGKKNNNKNNKKNKMTKMKKEIMLDHALVLLFNGPNSFSGEDLVEIHCHGSRAVVQGIMDVIPKIVLPNNTSDDNDNDDNNNMITKCRLAEPGEFTQRAYANGKLDLIQIEGLADILSADTQIQLQQALNQLDGTMSKIYDSWRGQLISGLAHAEAVIDFGDDERLGDDDDDDEYDDDIDTLVDQQQWNVWGGVTEKMNALQTSMERHLRDERRGELVRDGVKIGIIGPPNAGKSSLFNILSRQDAAIVSPIAGTTRDVLYVSMDLNGIKCTLQDTAGVRDETDDVLEMEGMKRTQIVVENADIIVALIDGTESIVQNLQSIQSILLEKNISSKHVMLVINKLDLLLPSSSSSSSAIKNTDERISTTTTTAEEEEKEIEESMMMKFGGKYEISCVTQEGIGTFLDALTDAVVDRVVANDENDDDDGSGGGMEDGDTSTTSTNNEGALITRARHRQHVEAAVEALGRFGTLSRQGTMAVDMAAEELRLAASELGRITGAVDVEDVLDVLFTDFCIGK